MKKSLATFALLSCAIATSAAAKDIKHISKTMDIEQGQKIELNVAVGSLTVDICDCNEITLDITIEPANNSWSFFSSVDVDNIKLDIDKKAKRVAFEIDEDDIKQTWKVTMPASSALAFNMGVGEVEVNDFSNDLNADVGVGEVNVDTKDADYQKIQLESGVGDTSIRGFDGDVDTDRSIVSSTTTYHGKGEYSMDIDVGVGEIEVRR